MMLNWVMTKSGPAGAVGVGVAVGVPGPGVNVGVGVGVGVEGVCGVKSFKISGK